MIMRLLYSVTDEDIYMETVKQQRTELFIFILLIFVCVAIWVGLQQANTAKTVAVEKKAAQLELQRIEAVKQQNYAKTKAQLAALQIQLTELTTTADAAEKKITQLEGITVSLSQQLAESVEEKKQLHTHIQELKQSNDATLQQLHSTQQVRNTLQKTVEEKEKQFKKAVLLMSTIKAAKTGLNREMRVVEDKLEQTEKNYAVMGVKFEALQHAYNSLKILSKDEAEKLKLVLAERQQALTEVQQSNVDLQEQTQQQQIMIQQLNERNTQLEESYKQATQKIQALEEQIKKAALAEKIREEKAAARADAQARMDAKIEKSKVE